MVLWDQDVLQPLTFLSGRREVAGAKVSNVQDFFTVTQLAGNTKLYWEVVGCANVTSIASAIFDQVHGGSLEGVVHHFES